MGYSVELPVIYHQPLPSLKMIKEKISGKGKRKLEIVQVVDWKIAQSAQAWRIDIKYRKGASCIIQI